MKIKDLTLEQLKVLRSQVKNMSFYACYSRHVSTPSLMNLFELKKNLSLEITRREQQQSSNTQELSQ